MCKVSATGFVVSASLIFASHREAARVVPVPAYGPKFSENLNAQPGRDRPQVRRRHALPGASRLP